jgi:acyl dehydratase
MNPKYYWEDFPSGCTRRIGPRCVSAEEIIAFARQFDPQPFHIDAEEAAKSRFNGLIASGWHICALVMRMICDDHILESAGLGSPGAQSIRWKQPLRPGDAISIEATVLEARRSQRHPEVGILRWHWDVRNQHGESIAELETTGMIRCRSTASA